MKIYAKKIKILGLKFSKFPQLWKVWSHYIYLGDRSNILRLFRGCRCRSWCKKWWHWSWTEWWHLLSYLKNVKNYVCTISFEFETLGCLGIIFCNVLKNSQKWRKKIKARNSKPRCLNILFLVTSSQIYLFGV